MIHPTVAEERQQRALHRQQIVKLLQKAAPNAVNADELKTITPHYQQRISECRTRFGLDIRNVPRVEIIGGKPRKRDGGYRYVAPASEPSPHLWTKPGAPFGPEPFTLTSPSDPVETR